MLIAHRGVFNKYIKENSIKAFINAINDSKYIGFECDVRETKDHEFVINHDFYYDNNLINKYNLDELKKSGLCSLDDVLNLDTNKLILIDIKDINISIDKLIDKLNNSNKNIYVMSYNKKVLDKILERNIYFKVGLLNTVINSNKEYHKYNFIALLYSSITDNILKYFSKNNIEVFTYGITNYTNIYKNKIYYIIDDIKLK